MNDLASPPQFVRWDLARATADQLTDKYSSPPIPVLEIAEGSGIHVYFSNFGKYGDTISGFCNFEKETIFVNNRDSFER